MDKPSMIMKPELQALHQLQTRLTFLYLERCKLSRDANAITITDKQGTRLLSFLGEDWIVGHNVAFDICFLLAACTRLGNEPPGMHAIDTVVLSRKALSDMVANYRLETVARFLNLAERQSHRALPDAQLTAQLYIKLNEISVPVN